MISALFKGNETNVVNTTVFFDGYQTYSVVFAVCLNPAIIKFLDKKTEIDDIVLNFTTVVFIFLRCEDKSLQDTWLQRRHSSSWVAYSPEVGLFARGGWPKTNNYKKIQKNTILVQPPT